MKLLILLHHRFDLWRAPPWFSERLSSAFPDVQVVYRDSYDGIESDLADTDILVTWSLRADQLSAAKKLKWIHSPAAAVHLLLTQELVESEIVVSNARDVHGAVVAEHAVALMLALAKRLPSALRYQQKRTWAQAELWEEQPRPRELSGAKLLLIGFGAIGSKLAQLAACLGMKVVVVREHPELAAEGAHEVHRTAELNRLLPTADFVVLAAPLTEKTTAMIDAKRLALMREDGYLINVARGPLVDEGALIDTLRARRIGGAAVDVFETEPLPANSPLWELDNLLITPHSAGVTERLWERHYVLLSSNLRRFKAGEPLLGLVDKRKGY